jgi:hypothetical protein
MAAARVSVQLVSEDARAYRLEVRVAEGSGETAHDVTLARDLLGRLGGGETPRAFVERCFAFLLEREPKESILRHFDVSVIARYFPDFEAAIRRTTK